MRCSKSFLSSIACLIAATAIGTAWSPRASAEDFDWRNYNGQNWIEPVIGDQGPTGECYAFGMAAMLETNYYMTRNDSSYKPDMSALTISGESALHGRPGLDFLVTHGIVVEQELPFQMYSTLWPPSTGVENRVYRATAASALGNANVAMTKAALKKYGPIAFGFGANTAYYNPPDANPTTAHVNTIVGFHDDPAVPGGGYWILKNSWGAGWSCSGMAPGYATISYAYGPSFQQNSGQFMPGAAYYTGSLANATWTGAGIWSKDATSNWTNNYDASAYAWENKETNATFNGPGGAVNISGSVIAHGIAITSPNYVFSGGLLTITAGGLAATESATIASDIYIGGPQKWWVSYGKTLSVGVVHTIISDLHVYGSGTTLISGLIDGGGMINGMGRKPGGLIVSGISGKGRLTLTANNNFAGDITVDSSATDLTIAPTNGTATYSGAWFGNGITNITSTTGIVKIGGGNSNYTGGINKYTGGTLSFIPADGMKGTFSGPIAGTTTIMQNGPGTTVFAGVNSYSGTTTIVTSGTMTNSVLQADIGVGIPSASFLDLAGGVLQSNSAITFSRSLGTSGSKFRMTSAGGGFSAGAGPMTVRINNGGNLTWSTSGNNLVGPLKLNSPTANYATIVENNINLNGSSRTIFVDDNPANIMGDSAWMTGVISGTGSSGINKTGPGALLLSGPNTYSGTTTLSGGVTQADIGVGIPANSFLSMNGGILQSNTATTFTRTLGTTGSAFAFGSNGGGFAGGATNLTVNVGGDGRQLAWGSVVGSSLLGTLRLGSFCSSHFTTLVNELNLNAATRTIEVNSADPATIYSTISGAIVGGSGSLIKTGKAILIMTGAANTYTGSTTIKEGSLQLNKSGVAIPGDLIFSAGTNPTSVTLFNWGQLAPNCKVIFQDNEVLQRLTLRGHSTTIAGLVETSMWGAVENSVNDAVSPCVLTIDNSTDCIFRGSLVDSESGSGALSVIKTGTGVQTLEGQAIGYTGSTTINGGTLVLKDILSPTGLLTRLITTNATLEFNNSVQRDMLFSGLISGTGGVTKSGPRGTILTNANNYTGTTKISGGMLQADCGVGIPTNSTIALDGGTLQSNSAVTFTRSLGTGSGQVYFTANGGGFAGGADVMTVNIGNGTALTWGTNVGSQIVGPLMLSSTRASSAVIFQNSIDLNGAIRTIQVDDYTGTTNDYASMTGTLSGTGSSGIRKTGDGGMVLSGANTYSGNTIISGGTLQAVIGTGIPSASFLSLDGGVLQCPTTTTFTRSLGTTGSTFQFTANGGGFASGGGPMTVNIGGNAIPSQLTWGTTVGSQIVGTLRLNTVSSSWTTTFQNPIDLNGATRTVRVDRIAAVMSGVLSGSGSLKKTGDSSLYLTANNTYTGSTIISSGVLFVGAGGTTGAIASSSIVNDSYLAFNRSDSYTYAGQISGNGTVYQSGSGMTTLSSTTNIYKGGTVVAAGTLSASSLGAAGSKITVNAGATLQTTSTLPITNYGILANSGTVTNAVALSDNGKATGSGVFGAVNVLNNGVFQPGTGAAATTAHTGSVTWNPGGKYRLDLVSGTGIAGTDWDLWSIAGDLQITNTYNASPFKIEALSVSATDGVPSLMANFDSSQSYDWQIISCTGLISGFSSSTVQVDLGVFQNPINGTMYLETRDNGHSMYLCYDPYVGAAAPPTSEVPEPASFVMLLALGLGLLGVRFFQNRRKP